jgi:hypothetical protein
VLHIQFATTNIKLLQHCSDGLTLRSLLEESKLLHFLPLEITRRFSPSFRNDAASAKILFPCDKPANKPCSHVKVPSARCKTPELPVLVLIISK